MESLRYELFENQIKFFEVGMHSGSKLQSSLDVLLFLCANDEALALLVTLSSGECLYGIKRTWVGQQACLAGTF